MDYHVGLVGTLYSIGSTIIDLFSSTFLGQLPIYYFMDLLQIQERFFSLLQPSSWLWQERSMIPVSAPFAH